MRWLISQSGGQLQAAEQSLKNVEISLGLEADIVFIMGCNDGNIPGQNRSTLMNDLQHTEETTSAILSGVYSHKEIVDSKLESVHSFPTI